MKSIKKITKAVAGSALLVGATLAGGAAMGAASSHGGSSGNAAMADLGDYPHPFVGEDGQVQSTVVVGADAKTVDVVGATNIAGQLGNDAVEEVAVSGMGSYGWSATGGVSLDTQNDQLYYGSALNDVRETLTAEHLDVLADTEFRDDGGDETEVTNYLNVGNQQVTFGKNVEVLDNEDPALHVAVPTEGDVDEDSYVYNLQANFEDSINFTHDDVKGEDIELFGRTYTVAQDANDVDDDEIVLYGSSQEVNLDSGQSTTVTVDGEEHTIELTGVTSNDEAVLMIDGEREVLEEDETATLGDQEVRADAVFNYDAEEGTDSVTLSMGSEELRLTDEAAIQNSDGDDVEGTYVEFNDGGSDDAVADGVSSITVYVGGEDDDQDALMAGDTWSHSLFENVELHFGGLNPNAAEGGEGVSEVEVTTSGDDTATVDFTSDTGDSASVEYVYDDSDNAMLADSDGDEINAVEGANVTENEYFTSDAGDFSHMWEVTSVERDDPADSTPEATVNLKDVVSGDSVEVELEEDSNDDDYSGTEIIDGQTYYFWLEGATGQDDGAAELNVAWGDGAGSATDGVDTGQSQADGATSVYIALDTESGSSVAFHKVARLGASGDASGGMTLELPSTESTDAVTKDVTVAAGATTTVTTNDGLTYRVKDINTGTDSGEYNDGLYIGLNDTVAGSVTNSDAGLVDGPAAFVIQPENENDVENAYSVMTGYDGDDNEVTVSAPDYTGERDTATMEDDDNVDAGYDVYGAYTEHNDDGQGSFSLWQPNGQAVAGAAFTGADGSLSAGASGSATSWQPTGWGDHAALDSDGNVADLKQNQNLILVGGPAVNDLTAELADGNKTWTGDQYEEGDAVLDLVHNAFSDGHHAMVVAGYAGEDTRMAANYLADYTEHQDELAGQTTLNVGTQ